jgi:hypothetical protein
MTLLALLACADPPPPAKTAPNILVVSLDTVRADALKLVLRLA